MKIIVTNKIVLPVAAGLFVMLTGCAPHEPTVYNKPVVTHEVVVTEAPPPVVIGERTASPGHDYVWVESSWVWSNQRWVRDPGHWVRPPHHGARWVPSRYAYQNGVHYYAPGYWMY